MLGTRLCFLMGLQCMSHTEVDFHLCYVLLCLVSRFMLWFVPCMRHVTCPFLPSALGFCTVARLPGLFEYFDGVPKTSKWSKWFLCSKCSSCARAKRSHSQAVKYFVTSSCTVKAESPLAHHAERRSPMPVNAS